MRDRYVIMLGIGCVAGSVVCGVLASRLPTEKPTALVAYPVRLELEELRQKEEKEVGFRITNPLHESVLIIDVRSTCACTSLKAGQRILEPGQSMTVTGTFDAGTARGESGALVEVLYRRSSASVVEKLELQVVATVMPHYAVTPERIVLPNPRRKEVQAVTIALTPTMPPALKVLDAATDNPAILVREITLDAANGTTTLHVRIDPSRNLREPLQGTIVLRTDSKMQPFHRIAVRSDSGETN